MFKLYSYSSSVLDFEHLDDPTQTWELGDMIGEGTYGAVHRGTHKATGTTRMHTQMLHYVFQLPDPQLGPHWARSIVRGHPLSVCVC